MSVGAEDCSATLALRGGIELLKRSINRNPPFTSVGMPMALQQLFQGPRSLLLGCALLSLSAVGCQSTIGGQTLPSAHYLQDDVQYHPAGPEFRLSRQAEALERYKLQQQGVDLGSGPVN